MEDYTLGDKMRFLVRDRRPIPVATNIPESIGLAQTADSTGWARERLVEFWILVMQVHGTGARPADQMLGILYSWVTDAVKLALRCTLYGQVRDEADLAFFLLQCQKKNLDPWGGEVYPIIQWDARRKQSSLFMGVRHNKMRRVAMATGKYVGLLAPVHVESKDGDPISSTVTVQRDIDGKERNFTATAKYIEFCPPDLIDPADLWHTKPFVCLDNIARSRALREAFPDECGQLYVSEEFVKNGRRSPDDTRGGGGDDGDDDGYPAPSEPDPQHHPLDDGDQTQGDGPANIIQLHLKLNMLGYVSERARNKFIATMRAAYFGLEKSNPAMFYKRVVEAAERDPARWADAISNPEVNPPPVN